MTSELLEDAWAALHAATPPGWYVGMPAQRHGGQWEMYAYDTREKAHIGKRSREWTAVGLSDEDLRQGDGAVPAEIGEGRVPN